MFTILPADTVKTARLAQREGVEGAVFALILTVGEEECGYALYRVERDTAELVCLRSQESDLEEWLVRAVLNAAANRNALTARCTDPVVFPLLQRLGFAANNGGYEVFIPDFFNRPCCGA